MRNDVGITLNPRAGSLLKAIVEGHEYHVQVVDQPVVPTAKFGAVMDGRDNTDAFMKAHDEVVRQGGGTVLMSAGDSLLNTLFRHPSVNFKGAGRNATRIRAAANIATLSDSAFGAREPALMYVLARARSTLGTDAFYPEDSDYQIDGNKGNQVNAIHGIHYENANHDTDFATWGGKAYSSGRLVNMEITNCSNSGVDISAERQRGFATNTRFTSNEGNGFSTLGNDTILGARCGAGGNALHQVKFSGNSGGLIGGCNVWGGGASRSDSCLAIHLNNVNNVSVVWNVINDTLSLKGGVSNNDRALCVTGNVFAPDGDYFSADGTPLGSASANRNAHIYVDGYKMVDIIGNAISRGNNPSYTFAYMLSAADAAGVRFSQVYSSEAGVKPYFTKPVLTAGAAFVREELYDLYAKISHSFGAHAYGWDSSLADLGTALPTDFIAANPQLVCGPLVLQNGFGGYEDESSRWITMVNGGSSGLSSKRRLVVFDTNVNNYTITLPTRTDALLCRELTIFFVGAVAVNLTWTPAAGDTILSAMPGTVAANTRVDLVYRPSTRQWIKIN